MIGFLLRKTLYDMWDNLLRIVLLNLGFIAVTAIPVFLPKLAVKIGYAPPLEMAISTLGIFLCSVYLAAASVVLKNISDYGAFGFSDFFDAFRIAWPAGIVMGIFIFFLFVVYTIVVPFYISIESGFGLILAAIVFWMSVFAILSFQFFFTAYVRISSVAGSARPSLKKALKKCMIVSLDNSGLSVFLLLHNILSVILSFIFLFLFPGPAGILLYIDEALRLRLLKYDWLEANPGANRKKIPWDVILIEEREKTGERTFKNFIFPWKD